jgi:hypothetical protein
VQSKLFDADIEPADDGLFLHLPLSDVDVQLSGEMPVVESLRRPAEIDSAA